ncbi:AMP-binding protein [Sphingomonas fennica]|uniref:AMP-dependent synthetase/ligase domain-containing protein n=1 Tax=Edaphosphingomonas fennica TaxID=114404 RepID=A0A2T4I648_9SPHN|nr:AMP-binding protein [Sphingomonas fennica]PTD26108.1 hypothetical protein CV103_03615 [Sphingomonas fennica]
MTELNANPFRSMSTVGVVATNSAGYVRQMIGNLERGRISVPLTRADDDYRLQQTFTTDIAEPESGAGWIDMPFRSRGGDEPAQISFTSGTQGTPKAVLLSHGNLHDVVVRVTEAMAIDEGIREYIGIPVYHSFGYARCRIVLNAGGRAFIPEHGFDLQEIQRMLRAGEINAISAVPTLWRIFLAARDRFGAELERVRWVEIGSQYMSGEEKAALRAALPNARIVQHYGLTEASRTTLQSIDREPLETLDSVGEARGGVEIRINARGRIETRGPHVALGILDGGKWQAIGRDEWLETSDMGRIEDGRLYFLGRGDDVINIAGIKLSPDLLESAVRLSLEEQQLDSGDFALLRRADPLRGDGIGLVVTPATSMVRDQLVEAIASHAQALGVNARGAITVHEVESLPRTDTGKIQRTMLATLLNGKPAAHPGKALRVDERAEPESFARLLETCLGRPVDPAQSFAGMGGDSLGHLQVALALERALDGAPAGWEWLPLGDLIAQVDAAGDFATLMAQGEGGAPPLPDGSRNMNPPGISFWSLVAEDYRANGSKLSSQGFLMLFIHRFGNWRMGVRLKPLRMPLTVAYRFLNKLAQILFGMKLDYTVKVGRRVRLEHFGGMILGARAIGNDVVIRQNTTFGIRSMEDLNAKPIIGDGVDIGAGAVIVGNITIGEHSVIGANSVIFTNIPPYSIAMGVPAKVVGQARRPA